MTINQIKKQYIKDENLENFIVNLLHLLNNDNTLLPKLIIYYDIVLSLKTKEIDVLTLKIITNKIIRIDSYKLDTVLNNLLQKKILVFVIRNNRRYLKVNKDLKELKINKEEINQVLTMLHFLQEERNVMKVWKSIKESGIRILLKDNYGITLDGLIEAVYVTYKTDRDLIKKTIWNLHYKKKLEIRQTNNERGTKVLRTYVLEIKKN